MDCVPNKDVWIVVEEGVGPPCGIETYNCGIVEPLKVDISCPWFCFFGDNYGQSVFTSKLGVVFLHYVRVWLNTFKVLKLPCHPQIFPHWGLGKIPLFDPSREGCYDYFNY